MICFPLLWNVHFVIRFRKVLGSCQRTPVFRVVDPGELCELRNEVIPCSSASKWDSLSTRGCSCSNEHLPDTAWSRNPTATTLTWMKWIVVQLTTHTSSIWYEDFFKVVAFLSMPYCGWWREDKRTPNQKTWRIRAYDVPQYTIKGNPGCNYK